MKHEPHPPGAVSDARLRELRELPDSERCHKKLYWLDFQDKIDCSYMLFKARPTHKRLTELNYGWQTNHYFFENYWHVYAYMLRIQKNDS